MYNLIISTPTVKVWLSSNGYRVTIIRGVFISKLRYPQPGSKRWQAMLP